MFIIMINNITCYRQINGKALLCDNKEGEFSEHIKSLNQEIINYK